MTRGGKWRLHNDQLERLTRLVEAGDRDRAEIFVGREREIDLVFERVRIARNRLQREDPNPAASLTLVFQGAPGAGKSALLAKLKSMGGDAFSAIEIPVDAMAKPKDDCLHVISEALAKACPGFSTDLVSRLLAGFSITGSVGIISATKSFGDDGTAESDRLAAALGARPVLLLLDEVQTIDIERAGANLVWLHVAAHGLPLIPVYGGLADSADRLNAAGLTRLREGSVLTLQQLTTDEVAELWSRFAHECLAADHTAADAALLDGWFDVFRADSQGWPMHCANFLTALGAELLVEDDGLRAGLDKTIDNRPSRVDIDGVRAEAARRRCNYYGNRLAKSLAGRPGLVSVVLEQLRRKGPQPIEAVRAMINRAAHPAPTDHSDHVDFRWDRPEGASSAQVARDMIHTGIVQGTRHHGSDYYDCPIPSLASWMAAVAALPEAILHGSALDGSLNAAMVYTHRHLLHARDVRDRTPLLVAAESGLLRSAELLVDAELDLPPDRRSLAQIVGLRELAERSDLPGNDRARIKELANRLTRHESEQGCIET